MEELEFNNGILYILNRYKKNYLFLENGYREFYNGEQLFEKFEKLEEFCFKYACIDGCSNNT